MGRPTRYKAGNDTNRLKTMHQPQQQLNMNKQKLDDPEPGPAVTIDVAYNGPEAGAVLYRMYMNDTVVAVLDLMVPWKLKDTPDISVVAAHNATIAEMTPAVENLLQQCACISNGDIATTLDLFTATADTSPYVPDDVRVIHKPDGNWWDDNVTVPDNVPFLFG